MRRLLVIILLLFVLSACSQVQNVTIVPTTETIKPATENFDIYQQARQDLLEEIKVMGVKDQAVLRAIAAVPREKFVPAEYLEQAYRNHPLPIGYGQTISQPYMVAWMTELLELQPGEKVLEIGTGSGYQAAVLAELGYVEVYSIEIVPELADLAAARLQQLGYTNIHTKQGDGYYGWAEFAPFDAILVTAAPDHLPAPLAEQLSGNGRIVIPIGPPGWVQSLWKFIKVDGELTAYNLGGVQFVPFTGPGVENYHGDETPIP